MPSEEQASTYRFLEAWKKQSENSGTRAGDDLQRLRQELLNLSQTVQQLSLDPVTGSALRDSHDATAERMMNLISNIITARGKAEKEQRILSRLAFSGIRRRENAIEPARAGSYRWLLYPPPAPSSPEMPGSGQSRLFMKEESGRLVAADLEDAANEKLKALWEFKQAVETAQSLHV